MPTLEELEASRDPAMGYIAGQGGYFQREGGPLVQLPAAPQPAPQPAPAQMPTMSGLQEFQAGPVTPTYADLYKNNPAQGYARLRELGVPEGWRLEQVPLRPGSEDYKLYAEGEKQRFDIYKTQKDIVSANLQKAREDRMAAEATAREAARKAAELAKERGTLKPGYQWDTGEPTKQVMVPGGPAWREQSSKHATDLSTLRGVEEQAKNATETINDILSNREGFTSNFGGYNALVTQYLPTDATQKVRAQLESLKSGLKTAGLSLIRGGGSIGQITEREWPILERMIENITPTLGEKDAAEALQRVASRLRNIVGNVQEAYKKEWGDSPFVAATREIGVPGVRERVRAGGYADSEKERRYQEWKARQQR